LGQPPLEVVTNYNTGEISGFASGGLQVGFNGGFSGNVIAGNIYNLGTSNSNYSGPFTTAAGSLGTFGGFASCTARGVTSPFCVKGAPSVLGVSAGKSGFGPASLTASATSYSKPLPLGNIKTNGFASPLAMTDLLMFAARQLCQ